MQETQSSWLADGVREIERVVTKGLVVEPKIIPIPGEKPGTYGIVTPGAADREHKIDFRVTGPIWHNERLDNPRQLIEFIKSMEAREVKAAAGAVYIGQTSITYVYDFEDRRHRATCPLIVSQPWQWLTSPKVLTQKDAVRDLRITFDGCLPRDSSLVVALRNVKWTDDGKVEGTVIRGKEALGASITREIQGINDFPEEFTVTVKVYENVLQDTQIRVALEILPDAKKFEFIAFPNQLHDGLAEVQTWLLEDIQSATGAPTFIGSVTAEA